MNGRKKWCIGIITGLINGLIGVGGTLLVPSLVHLLGAERKTAHGTSLVIILPTTLISIIIYGSYGITPYRMGGLVAAGGLFGGYLGALLLRKVSTPWLKKTFALLMIYAGVRMLWI